MLGTMALAEQLIEVYKGEDKLLRFTAVDKNGVVTPTAISGWTIVFTIRPYKGAPTITLQKTGGSIQLVDTQNGIFTVTLAAADTTAIVPGEYRWDVWRTDSGFATDLADGTFNLIGDVRI